MIEQVSDDEALLGEPPPEGASPPPQGGPGVRRRPQDRLSKYGSSTEPPRDDAVLYPVDDTHGFFAKVDRC